MRHKLMLLQIGIYVILLGAVHAQSSFLLQNFGDGIDTPVFDGQGIPLAGSNYIAELWGGPTPETLREAVGFDLQQPVLAPFLTGGYFRSNFGWASILPVPPRGWAWLQVRAWDARLGATYEEVRAGGLGGYGESPLFYAAGGDPFAQFPTAGKLDGLETFALRAEVPEPRFWRLCGIASIGLWWAARRRLARRRSLERIIPKSI